MRDRLRACAVGGSASYPRPLTPHAPARWSWNTPKPLQLHFSACENAIKNLQKYNAINQPAEEIPSSKFKIRDRVSFWLFYQSENVSSHKQNCDRNRVGVLLKNRCQWKESGERTFEKTMKRKKRIHRKFYCSHTKNRQIILYEQIARQY